MHWWQLWLGAIGVVITATFLYPPKALRVLAGGLLNNLRQPEQTWLTRGLYLFIDAFFSAAVTLLWLVGFAVFSGAFSWQFSVAWGGAGVLAYILIRLMRRRDEKLANGAKS